MTRFFGAEIFIFGLRPLVRDRLRVFNWLTKIDYNIDQLAYTIHGMGELFIKVQLSNFDQ